MRINLFRHCLSTFLLLALGTISEAQLHHLTVQVQVYDPDRNPVAGATVTLGLPMYARGADVIISAQTDKNGAAKLTGDALFDYSVGVKKAGYYSTMAPMRTIATEEGVEKYASGVQQFDLELKPIRNPIPMLGGGSGNGTLRMPSMTQPISYDLEEGDWVAPWGKGTTPDFVFQVSGYAKSRTDYDQTLTLRFSNPGDGIQSFSDPKGQESEFVFPYEAPSGGFQSEWTWRMQHNAQGTIRDYDPTKLFIFRVRTELNSDGTVKRALYGVLPNSLIFVPGEQATGVKFSYYLNPTWTTNLEIDHGRSVHAGPH